MYLAPWCQIDCNTRRGLSAITHAIKASAELPSSYLHCQGPNPFQPTFGSRIFKLQGAYPQLRQIFTLSVHSFLTWQVSFVIMESGAGAVDLQLQVIDQPIVQAPKILTSPPNKTLRKHRAIQKRLRDPFNQNGKVSPQRMKCRVVFHKYCDKQGMIFREEN